MAGDCPDWKEGASRAGEEVHAESSPEQGFLPYALALWGKLMPVRGCGAVRSHWCFTSLHVRAPASQLCPQSSPPACTLPFPACTDGRAQQPAAAGG